MTKKIAYVRRRNPIMSQPATKAKIKVRLDARTIVTIPDMSAFKMWKEKYPGATVFAS